MKKLKYGFVICFLALCNIMQAGDAVLCDDRSDKIQDKLNTELNAQQQLINAQHLLIDKQCELLNKTGINLSCIPHLSGENGGATSPILATAPRQQQ